MTTLINSTVLNEAMTTSSKATMTLAELYAMWARLGDIPTVFDSDHVDCLDEPFHTFPAGTPCENVWHWFERQNPNFIVGEVMQGIHRLNEAVDTATIDLRTLAQS